MQRPLDYPGPPLHQEVSNAGLCWNTHSEIIRSRFQRER